MDIRFVARASLIVLAIAPLAACINSIERVRTIATARPINPVLLSCSLGAMAATGRDSYRQGKIADQACPSPYDRSTTTNAPPRDGYINIASESEKKAYLGAVMYDSLSSCNDFMDGLVKNQGDARFAGDAMTALFTAAATAIKPITTVHALTAAGSFTAGTETAFLSGFYAKAAVDAFAAALNGTYYVSEENYMNKLLAYTETVVVPVELTRIEKIHSMCSLSAMQATIISTLNAAKGTGATAAQGIDATLDFSPSQIKPNDGSTLTVSLLNGTGSDANLIADFPVSISPAVPAGTSPSGTCKSTPTLNEYGTAIVYAKGAVVPASGCNITLVFQNVASNTIIASIAANSLNTDKGSNGSAVSKSLTVSNSAAPAATAQPASPSASKAITTPAPGQPLQSYPKQNQP